MTTQTLLSIPACDLRPGDMVKVRNAMEILSTLDADGTIEGVVFMPEMIEHVGRCYRVLHRLEKTCIEGSPAGLNEFRNNDVVFLKGLRCDGASHDGCMRSCMIFWKEAWLTRIADNRMNPPIVQDEQALAALRTRLRAAVTDHVYFCQSTNLLNATIPLSALGRLWKCLRDVRVRTYTVPQIIVLIVKPLIGKKLLLFRSRVPKTDRTKTPKGVLDLQPGDWVEVKSVDEIAATLDVLGRNRGLQWSYDLLPYCGRRFRVSKRLGKMIVEYTSGMVQLSDTVLLEGAHCTCKYVVGGCPRMDLIYWREIWLRKIEPTSENEVQKLME